jgi:hypothetical protein
VQFGATAMLELNCLAGLQLEERSPLLGLRNRELFGALLDFNPDFAGDLFQRVPHPVPQIEIRASDDYAHEYQRDHKPSTQPCSGDGH